MNGSGVVRDVLKPIDALGLYAKEVVVDPDAGEITVLRPVTVGGVRDTERKIRFFSSIMMTFRGRPQQVAFELEASTLSEAVQKWAVVAREAGEKAIEQMEDAVVRSRLQVPAGARMGPVN